MRAFNTTGLCVPEDDYMVDITDRLNIMKEMIEEGQYFVVNRGRQYGKTTTLAALEKYLQDEYYVVSMDFQDFGESSFGTEERFCRDFTGKFCEIANDTGMMEQNHMKELIAEWMDFSMTRSDDFRLMQLFGFVTRMCKMSDKPLVLFIDEVDRAANDQVFLDFLAQLRSLYLKRKKDPKYRTFQSVVLAGVTNVKNLKRKLRPDETSKVNSPWNIAVDFSMDMSLSSEGIVGMLTDYEEDHRTGMDVKSIAQELRDYTGGYPFLVSRICQILDRELAGTERFPNLSDTWTPEGIDEAARIMVSESNTLFDSLMGKIVSNSEMRGALEDLLFSGKDITYNRYNFAVSDAVMYGFIVVAGNKIQIANRIFEMLLYNYYLSENEMKHSPIYRAASNDRDKK